MNEMLLWPNSAAPLHPSGMEVPARTWFRTVLTRQARAPASA